MIQPYCFPDVEEDAKNLTMKELPLMRKIIMSKPSCRAVIKDIVFIDESTLVEFPGLKKAYDNLKSHGTCWGMQYLKFARFARMLHQDLTLSLEKGVSHPYCPVYYDNPLNTANSNIRRESKNHRIYVDKLGNYPGRFYSKDFNVIFQHFRNCLSDISEPVMLNWLLENDFSDIIPHVHFCRRLLKNNHPCGICDCCLEKIEAGMLSLFPEDSLRNFHAYQYLIDKHSDNKTITDFLNFVHGNFSFSLFYHVGPNTEKINLYDESLKSYLDSKKFFTDLLCSF